jgi:glycosyltransferase involved in cell wall biosynthesis
MQPLVSILIPAYKAQEWIVDTLRSALAQTWPRIEIIVVDDGSTDPTLAIARQFESESVRVISQKNQGAAAARNKALSLCHGDYIQSLDADDLLASDKIAKQMEVLAPGEAGHFSLHPGDASCTGPTGRSSFPLLCGVTCLQRSSCCASWNKRCSCKQRCGSSVAS